MAQGQWRLPYSHPGFAGILYLISVLSLCALAPFLPASLYTNTGFISMSRDSFFLQLLLPSVCKRLWKDLPAQLLEEGCLGWVPNMNWLRTGGDMALSLRQQQKEPGAARHRGCRCWQSLPADLDPSVSAGCLLQHQGNAQG